MALRPSPPLLVLAGPTGTGKTGTSIAVARALSAEGIPAEVISADSRQVYRGLDIGTAKATPAERGDVPHHGLDLVEPDEPFSVAGFVRHAVEALHGLAARGGIAILAGGTGLYLRAVARGLDVDALPSDEAVRERIETALARDGVDASAARLRAVAPALAATTDLRNPRRVARALEIAELAGDRPRPPTRGYEGPVAWLGLDVEAATHARWLHDRARRQFDSGLVEEARGLRERFDPGLPAFSAIGYAEAWAYLDGEVTLDEAIELDARRNVAFAKRQRTWFRSEPDIEWLTADAGEGSVVRTAVDTARRLRDASDAHDGAA
ncbi:MAG TPA: tRNA (adenosine(37)-N6)-dimethylallyltransferase MiaA [Candidatus Limnocylindrales bacterium]|nr:tRNA (adenosine(37)-N6)-dimethylallyltransferase MiaA [Candidatus Limnocylindrales bacterium]